MNEPDHPVAESLGRTDCVDCGGEAVVIHFSVTRHFRVTVHRADVFAASGGRSPGLVPLSADRVPTALRELLHKVAADDYGESDGMTVDRIGPAGQR